MKLGAKLNTAFFSIVFLLLVSTVITVINLNSIDDKSTEALEFRLPQVQLVDDIRVNTAMQGLYTRALILEPTKKNKENLLQYAKELDSKITELETIARAQEMKNYLQKTKNFNSSFNASLEKLIAAIDNNQLSLAKTIVVGEMNLANAGILENANNMLAFQQQQLDEIDIATEEAVDNSKVVAFVALILSAIIAVILYVFGKRMVTKPLAHLMVSAKQIAKGDLTASDLHLKSKDEIGQLAEIFNEMKQHLQTLIGSVQNNANQLNVSAQQLSASTEEVAATAEDVTEQVTKATTIAANAMKASTESAFAMDETAQGVHRIAESAQTLHSSSEDAIQTASNGASIIETAKDQMHIINDSTLKVNNVVQKLAQQTAEIKSITAVITDITDQTNLLALNASIEAARAGEHGKGFAVVADEVRKLAEQSKASAQSIVQLTVDIEANTNQVEDAVAVAIHSVQDGVNIITEAGSSFEGIVEAVNTMSTQIQEVSATAEQMSASAEEVSASVAEVASGSSVVADGLSTISAAMEEQTATMQEVSSVAETLSNNAAQLLTEAHKFKL